MTIGIYCLTNMLNGKKWFGQSWNIEKRFNEHKCRNNTFYISNAISKYGWDNFEKDIIIIVNSQEDLDEYETKLIEIHNTRDRNFGYNIKEGGRGGKHAEASKQKMSESHRGHVVLEETKQKQSDAKKGKKNPFYGKKHTKESKQKISEKSKGRKHTEETKQIISEKLKGKVFSGSHRKNISKSKKGYKHSEERKRKQSERQKGKKRGPYKSK